MDLDINKKLLSLQEISKAQLSKILNLVPHKKNLVLEPDLIKPLERVCGVNWLKGNGVDKIYKLDAVVTLDDSYSVFYMINLDSRLFKRVVDQIRSQVDIEKPIYNKYHIIVIPRYLTVFEDELEEFGLLHSVVRIHSFQWMPLYIDTGLLTLEIPDLYSSLFVYQNYTYLSVISKCLWQLSFVIGKAKCVIAVGEYANAVMRQFDDLCENRGDSDRLECDFRALIVLDRNVDYTSALLTPGNYSALLNEVYRVNVGVCENKEGVKECYDDKFNPVVNKEIVNINLDGGKDSIYDDIKNRYFTEVTSVLSNLTKQLKSESSKPKDMALDEIKRYVQTQLQSAKIKKKLITNHLLAAESIINVLGHRYENQKSIESNILRNTDKNTNLNYLEELLCTENDALVTLRLFCLLVSYQSLNENEIRSFWRKFLHQFGHKYGFAYDNLISTGFIPQNQSKLKLPIFTSTNNQTVSKTLKQIPADPDKINLKHPTCPSYVFGGNYIPLVTQIAAMVLNSVPIDEIRTKLDVLGKVSVKQDKGFTQNRTLLVFLIGGVTYAEVAACNLLESLTGSQIVIMTDRVVTGNDLIKGLLEYPK